MLLQRLPENPILQPRSEYDWESQAVHNTAALYLDGKVHLLYRAIGSSGLSVLGYAASSDGVHIQERSIQPVYCAQPYPLHEPIPYQPFPYASGCSFSGCEDPRLICLEDKIYMIYTAFDGMNPPAVALSSLSVQDFLNQNWCWKAPIILSKRGESHKNWTIFPEKINGQYAILHSISPDILIEYRDSLEFEASDTIESYYRPTWREGYWDNWIRGVGAPPIKTSEGWLVLYHAMDRRDPDKYKIGAKLLDLADPTKVLYRLDNAVLSPEAPYENEGFKSGVVYTCGAVVIGETLLVYYGGADTVVCAASINLSEFLKSLKQCPEKLVASLSSFTRAPANPLLKPSQTHSWENFAAFNPCVSYQNGLFHMVYRAISSLPEANASGQTLISSIGYAVGNDPYHFKNRKQLVAPEYEWERFGCEDPRVTYFEGLYYIFYTALSQYPFSPDGIRVGLATTRDFKTLEAKSEVTFFNAKAMTLFPERIQGKMAALLTVDTDLPPAKIALALFDEAEDLYSEDYWAQWHAALPSHILPLLKDHQDQVEVGAPPLKTAQGWLLIYAYIYHYTTPQRTFTVQAVLLDLKDPRKILGHTQKPLLLPEKKYEKKGYIPDIVFPSGALIQGEDLFIYYGAADTYACASVGKLSELLSEMTMHPDSRAFLPSRTLKKGFERWRDNPILTPRPEIAWEARSVFNPAAFYAAGRVHMVYRAMSYEDTSVFGYASSADGIHFDERFNHPIYTPHEIYEQKKHPGNSGCEDPRITQIGDQLYVFYTAFDGDSPRVAFSSISLKDFLHHRWNWVPPKVITSPEVGDKDACLFPEKIGGKYIILNRPNSLNAICINFLDDLEFKNQRFLNDLHPLIKPEEHNPPVKKVGISTQPLKTEAGWLLFYHWVTFSGVYQVGAVLLALDDPTRRLSRLGEVLLEPEMDYEKKGDVNNVVFPCGAVLIGSDVFLYYGGADKVIGVCKMALSEVIR